MLRFYLIIATSVFVLDRVTKWLAHKKLRFEGPIEVIPNIFDLTYVQNSGIAFGLFRDAAWAGKNLVLSVIAIATILVILSYIRKIPREKKYVHLAMALILGGILGNLYDRLRVGYVVDFLDFHWYEHAWPTFNVADSAISISMVLLTIYTLRSS